MVNNDARIVALDIGSKRIGVATANVVAKLPQTLKTITVSDDVLQEISQLLDQQQAIAVVLGLPRGLEGQETAQTKTVREFGEQLKGVLTIPIYWQDEALTSHASEEILGKQKDGYQKGDVDAMAAQFILEDYLREHQNVEVTHA